MRRAVALTVLATAAAVGPPAAVAAPSLPSGRTTYRTLADVHADLTGVVAAHPGLARLVTLPGASVQGRPIEGVELAANVGRTDDGRPTALQVGLVHAREWPSAEVAVEHALDLAARYGRDTRVTRLLRRVRVVVVPVLNPDGLVATQAVAPGEGDPALGTGAFKRKNCSGGEDGACGEGVDLNRNAGAFWGGPGAAFEPGGLSYRGPAPFSEPETQAFRAFSAGRQVTLVSALHDYLGAVLHEPGFCTRGEPGLPRGATLPGAARMAAVAARMARAAGYVSAPACRLYDVTGALEDWSTFAQGALGLTTEIAGSDFHGPYAGAVRQVWPGMRELLLRADEAADDRTGLAVVEGAAPPGRVLRVARDVRTSTSYVLTRAGAGPAQLFPDHFETTLTVPAGGRFRWALTPSTPPLVVRAGGTLAWTLTCEDPAGAVLERHDLVAGAGATVRADLACGVPGAATALSSLAIGAVRRHGRRLTVRLGVRGGPLTGLRLALRDGRRRLRAAIKGSTVPARVTLRARRLSPGAYALRATARTAAGERVAAVRTLRVGAGAQ